MSTTLQHKRGSTSSHSTFTGAAGEITVNTTKNTAVVHNGSTSGGFELLRADLNNLTGSINFGEGNMPSGYMKHIYSGSVSTTTNVSLTTNYQALLSTATFTVPSGFTGLVGTSITWAGMNEDNTGRILTFIRLDGNTDYDTPEYTSSKGVNNNQIYSWGFTHWFSNVTSGSYTARVYAKIASGSNIITNHKDGEDIFTTNVFVEKS